MGGEGNPFAVLERDPHPGDRPLEGNGAHRERRRGAVERNDVERVLVVDGERRHDHVGLAAIPVLERRTKRPVYQAAREDGLFTRPSLPPEERAGNAANGIHPLLEVDGEWEEIDSLTHRLGGGGGDEDLYSAESGDDGAVSLSGELAGGEGHGLAADLSRNRDF